MIGRGLTVLKAVPSIWPMRITAELKLLGECQTVGCNRFSLHGIKRPCKKAERLRDATPRPFFVSRNRRAAHDKMSLNVKSQVTQLIRNTECDSFDDDRQLPTIFNCNFT